MTYLEADDDDDDDDLGDVCVITLGLVIQLWDNNLF
jgi:hypothetical protein